MHFICPVCKSEQLSVEEDTYECGNCRKVYGIIAGIPDLRIYPYPYSNNEDTEVHILLENYDKLDYLNLYKLRQSFFIDEDKGEEELIKVRELHEASSRNLRDYHMDYSNIFSKNIKIFRHLIGNRIYHEETMALELGCGKGTQIPDMLSIYRNVIAIDNSLGELIITKKYLEKKGIAGSVQLVCACSESLPFGIESFDVVNMRSVIEHVEDERRSMQEIHRILRKGGILLMETPNRYTFHKEPHVRVFGVGFVPRRWMKDYVYLMTRRQITYEGKKNPSYFELKTLLKKTFGTQWEHRVRLIDESRLGVTLIGKMYRRFSLAKRMVENLLTKFFCETHYVAAWKK